MANTVLKRTQIPSELVYSDIDPAFNTVITLSSITPTLDNHATNKKYVDDKIVAASTGLQPKVAVRVASSATVGTYNATGGTSTKGQLTNTPSTFEGITLTTGDRILVKNHSDATANGIYVVTTVGSGSNGVWNRAADFDSDSEVKANAFAFVEEGSFADTAWVLTTNNPIVLGGASGTELIFGQFAGSGVGVSTISITTSNGLSGTSSGGSTPTLTLSTNLLAGPIKSNGSGAFISAPIDLSSLEVSNTLPVARGGLGVNTITGLLFGNGTTAVSSATGTEVVNIIGSTAVTNSTNATNILVANDIATATAVYLTWTNSNTGNNALKVSSTALSFVPSTGILSATGFSGSGSALTALNATNLEGTISSLVLGNSNIFIGTTSISLNRASANLALTGILSTTFTGATSGTIQLIPNAVAGSNILTLPAITGTLVSTGDTATVTNTMLAGSITDVKLNQITTASKVNTSALTGTIFTLGSTAISALGTTGTLAGLTSVTSTTFIGSLTGSATSFTGSLSGDVTGTQTTTSISDATITGKVLTGYSSGGGTVSSADTILTAINKLNGNTALKQNIISATNYKVGVAVSGTANGVNLTGFTLTGTPITSTEMLFVNGVLQQRGAGNDYTISGNAITFETGNPPQAGSILLATYFI